LEHAEAVHSGHFEIQQDYGGGLRSATGVFAAAFEVIKRLHAVDDMINAGTWRNFPEKELREVCAVGIIFD
jgi:hypothetical protein